MGSIYEYPLQLVPGKGRRVPEFVMVHGVLVYNAYEETHFGYGEQGNTGNGVVEYTSEAALISRLLQLHALSPFTKDTGTEEEPVIVDLTSQEVEDMATEAWEQASNAKYAVIDGTNVVDYGRTFYDMDLYWRNVGLNGDSRTVVEVQPTAQPAADIIWETAPVDNTGTWEQQWASRAFTPYELEQYKLKRKAEINVERDSQISGGFSSSVASKVIDSDERSRQNLIGTAVAAVLDKVNDVNSMSITWRTADDSDVQLGRDDVINMALELLVNTQTIYSSSWSRKGAIDSMTTRTEIDAA